MEPAEINVVLLRASELHARIDDAIARALKSEFLITATRPHNVASPAAAGEAPEHQEELDGEVNAEAKSLGGIRDALETLEDQLECLQTLQYQQKVDRDAALAELEESRRILLRRLRSHRGNEWEVIQEALAFAGEPMEESQELPPMMLSMEEQQQHPQQQQQQIEQSQEQQQGNVFGIPFNFNFNLRNFANRLFGPGIGVTSRAAIVVASVLTVVLFSEVGSRADSRRTSSRSHSQELQPPQPQPRAPPTFQERCPPGKVMILQDGVPKCVVKERIEVPFHAGIGSNSSSPDVLFGRG